MKKHWIILLLTIFALACVFTACTPKEPEPTPAEISITLDKTELSMAMGQTTNLIATVSGTDKVATWTSSNESVVTVANGKVTAVADGSATITATIEDKSATCTITVSSTESITINRETVRVFKGETAQLTATVKKGLVEQDVEVTWTSSDTTYVMVDENGVVTGNKNTKTPVTITATTENGTSATCTVTVEKVVQIVLSQTEVTLHPNGSETEGAQYPSVAKIYVTGKDGAYSLNARSIDWTSSNDDIIEVALATDASGTAYAKLTAKKSGTVTISAKVSGSSEVAVCMVESWYAVSTPDDLEYMRTDINGVFKLVNDVDFEGAQWDCVTPWAGDTIPDSAYWGGILDGQGYAIKNINLVAGWNKGIIGQTNTTSIVRNLSIINLINQDTSNKVGSIISFNKGLIENCYIENTIQNDGPSNWNSHGGIVATNHMAGTIRNCIVKITASRTFKNCGAIIGYNCGAVENCYAICTDATLPMYGEWQSTNGYFSNCGVYSSEEEFLASAQLHEYSDKVWTKTGLSLPSLYHYAEIAFEKPTIYFAQGSRYTLQPGNLLGLDIDWSIDGNEGNVVSCEQNADNTLSFFARSKGEITLNVALKNGQSASVKIVVTGTVIAPDNEVVAIDYNNPALSDTDTIVLRTEAGDKVNDNLTFTSSDANVATVDENGVITAVGKGKCYITVWYVEDKYQDLVEVNVTAWEQISTAEQLQAIKDNYKLNYCLVNDIDFKNNTFTTITPWTNTDDDSLYFSGIFDGNGYTVRNVVVVGNNRGIFGRIATTAIVRNTVFENIQLQPASGQKQQETAGIVSFNTGIIQDIVVKVVYNAGHKTDYRTVGAICGTNEFRGRVYNCIAYADVSNVSVDNKEETIYLSVLMGLCQGVAKDCIGIQVGTTQCTVKAISYINSSSVSNCKMYTTESDAVSDNAPFGSFSTSVWNISSDKLPTLKKLA